MVKLVFVPETTNKPTRQSHNIVALPKIEPLQGKGKPQFGRNGKPVSNVSDALFGRGGGVHTDVIRKALSREQKVGVGAAGVVGAGLAAGSVGRAVRYGGQARNAFRVAQGFSHGPAHQAGATLKQYGAHRRKMALRNVGAATVAGGLLAGGTAATMSSANAANQRRTGVAKMSDAELRHRKRVQAGISIGTSTLGLSALGSKAGAGVLRKLNKAPGAAHRLDKATTNLLTSGAGLGGVGGFNFASVQRQEARKRTPVVKAYDPERNRERRARQEAKVAGVVGGAASGGALAAGGLAARRGFQRRDETTRIGSPVELEQEVLPGGGKTRLDPRGRVHHGPARKFRTANFGEKMSSATKVKGLKASQVRAGKVGVGLAALGVGGLVASDRIASYSRGKGRKYSPRFKRD
jgi:hypothetical protein